MSGLFDRPMEPLPPVVFGKIQLKRLRQTHPSLDCDYVHCLHALYRGGKMLLGDDQVMASVFPKHAHESGDSYNERKARAFYENNFAQVIDRVVAGLAQDPFRLEGEQDDEGKPSELDDYWAELETDATLPGESEKRTLDMVIRDAVCEALVARRAWILVDMPPKTKAASRAEEDEIGALDAYPVLYCADQVTDWCKKDERLLWVRSYSCEYPSDDPAQERGARIETWTYWSAEGWFQYKLRLDKDGKSQGTKGLADGAVPKDEDELDPEFAGVHGFGVVPWVCLDVCADEKHNLWLGDRLESQARNLMNEQCGEVYLRLRAMYQQLYEFLGKEMGGPDETIGEAQMNAARARGQRGPDIVQERGREDDAKFVAPEMDSAEVTLKSIHENRDGMFRVTGQMALSQDTKGAALRRSGDSKKQDKVETEIALGVVGKLALAFGTCVVEMIALGRGEKDEAPECAGYAQFDVGDAAEIIEQTVEVETLTIPSSTFKKEVAMRAVRAALGEEVTAEILEKIRKELDGAITQDAVDAMHNAPLTQMQQDQEGDDGKKPPPGKPAPNPVGAAA